jgi:ketosteroid isomerase-like protein
MMRGILLTALLVVSSTTFVKAQEATGPAAEQVKKEILALEHEKERAFVSTTSGRNYAVEWLEAIEADDIAFTNPYGVYTKDKHIAQVRAGHHKTYSVRGSDFHVRVYGSGGNGTTAVVTYINQSDGTHTGQVRSAIKTRGTDVFYKNDGKWRWIVHHHSFVEGFCGSSVSHK